MRVRALPRVSPFLLSALAVVVTSALPACRHTGSAPGAASGGSGSVTQSSPPGRVDLADEGGEKASWQLGLASLDYGGGRKWRYFNFKPPYILGPEDNLRFAKGVLSGITSGAPLEIKVEGTEAKGFIAQQPVQLDFHEQDGVIEVEGTFGGAYLRFVADGESIRASVPRNGEGPRFSRHSSVFSSPFGCCAEYIFERRPASENELPGFLVYVDDERGRSLPRWRLEIPQVLSATYTAPELALILIVLLS